MLYGTKGVVTTRPYDYVNETWEQPVEVSLWEVSKVIRANEIAYLLDEIMHYINANPLKLGEQIGKLFIEHAHLSVQARLVWFFLGIIRGMATMKLEWCDDRNRTAIAKAKQVAEYIDTHPPTSW